MYRMLGNMVWPSGPRGRLAILMLHRVLVAPDPILGDEIAAAAFERHAAFWRREFNVLPLAEACARLAQNSLPARALCLTFDDGYANNAEVALPILQRHGLSATFFVSTAFLEGANMFNDDVIEIVRSAPDREHDLSMLSLPSFTLDGDASRRAMIESLLPRFKYRPLAERSDLVAALAATTGGKRPRRLMMRPEDVKRLHDAGMEIGGHTVNHPILMQLDKRDARAEIVEGKRRLEAITGSPVTLFAYPNGKPGGDYGREHVEMVRRAGFCAAVSSVNGVASRDSDPFQLPRCGLWNQTPRRLGARLLVNCLRPVGPVPPGSAPDRAAADA